MYTTKPHFRQEIGGVLSKNSVRSPVKSLPTLRIQKKRPAFSAKNAVDFIQNPEKSGLISYESEV